MKASEVTALFLLAIVCGYLAEIRGELRTMSATCGQVQK